MKTTETIDGRLVRRIPYAFAKKHGVLLARETADGFTVLARAGVKSRILLELQRFLMKPVEIEDMAPDRFDLLLNSTYQDHMEQAREVVEDLDQDADLMDLARNLPHSSDLLESDNDAPVVRLINALLTQALREKVSDIHIEPFESRVMVRFRVDGVLRDTLELQKGVQALLVSRIKIMSRLDIAEKRLPQDGRFTLRLAGKTVDVRVSTLPTGNGERVVLRLLDKQGALLTLPALGLDESTLKTLDGLIHRPHGILLVTGPTGSGKTTTLYAALSRLNTKENNIMTVEDPIEYAMEGIGQTQVNSKTNLTFARALRAILRQDPDVVMIGEIRDLETAQIAVQASLTGHLVLATLHTNDSAGAVTRLVDMGLETFLVASSLVGVVAQRLVRKLCPDCRAPYTPSKSELQMVAASGEETPDQLYRPTGCAACGQTGYQGRTGIYELLVIDEDMRKLIHGQATETALRQDARARGMKTLRQDGFRWARSGLTSLEEILRVSSE